MTSITTGRKRLTRFASALKSCAASTGTRRFLGDRKGNATMLVAFAMPMVIGGGGMAIDFAQFYLWKRELQFANDQAAIAAAWEVLDSGSTAKMSDRAKNAFAVNEQITADFNTDPVVKLANYAGGVGNSVIVTSSATKRLPFTSFFTKGATTVNVSSQAAFSGGATINSCLIAVDKEDAGTVTIGGNAVFTAQCGIAALSNSSKVCTGGYDSSGTCLGWTGEDAIDDNGNSYEINAGSIATAGTVSDSLEEKAKANGDTIIEGATNLADPFEGVDPPSSDGVAAGTYVCKSTGKTKKVIDEYNNAHTEPLELGTAYPGVYEGGLSLGCDTVFKGGVYFIRGGTLTINGNYTATSAGEVMFVLEDGADFKINGGADINLTGMTEETLMDLGYSSEEAHKINTMLIFESPDNGEGKGSILNGNSNTYLNGAIYTKINKLDLSGTADVANACLLLVANKVNLTGTLKMTSWCPDPPNHPTTIIYGNVSLVA
jgi:Flp pilus assembly protein TadG